MINFIKHIFSKTSNSDASQVGSETTERVRQEGEKKIFTLANGREMRVDEFNNFLGWVEDDKND